jgi:hypothetical protein
MAGIRAASSGKLMWQWESMYIPILYDNPSFELRSHGNARYIERLGILLKVYTDSGRGIDL